MKWGKKIIDWIAFHFAWWGLRLMSEQTTWEQFKIRLCLMSNALHSSVFNVQVLESIFECKLTAFWLFGLWSLDLMTLFIFINRDSWPHDWFDHHQHKYCILLLRFDESKFRKSSQVFNFKFQNVNLTIRNQWKNQKETELHSKQTRIHFSI